MSLEDEIRRIVREELDRSRRRPDDDRITVAEYARRLSVSERTVRDAIRERRLAHERIGRAVRIPAGAKIEPRVDEFTARARLTLIGAKR